MTPPVVAFGRKFHAMSPWKDTAFDDDAVLNYVSQLGASDDGYFEITEGGMIGGIVMPLWFAPSTILGVELFWWSEEPGEGNRLRANFENWAIARGAQHVSFSGLVNEREAAVRRLMERQGYTAVEIAFRKAV